MVNDDLTLLTGDCLLILPTIATASIDAVVTDPPYELTNGKKGGTGPASINLTSPQGRSRISTGQGGFMGKSWDATGIAHSIELWSEVLRVLKPGGYVLAFGGSRTWHRLASAIEDSGFEIRDSIAWLYGSGFPKSLDVSKAIDKAAGVERAVAGPNRWAGRNPVADHSRQGLTFADDSYVRPVDPPVTVPGSVAAEQWSGWGTALKPAFEPIVVGRKPLIGTVAVNVLAHGTGALNIDACRIGEPEDKKHPGTRSYSRFDTGSQSKGLQEVAPYTLGRWPANVVLDEAMAAELDLTTGTLTSGGGVKVPAGTQHGFVEARTSTRNDAGKAYAVDSGGASRFFYVAKAAQYERPKLDGAGHPTVKPLDLMRWLIRLVTPPGGLVLDPFLGSGTTAEACLIEGFRCVGIERNEEYMELTKARLGKPIAPVLS